MCGAFGDAIDFAVLHWQAAQQLACSTLNSPRHHNRIMNPSSPHSPCMNGETGGVIFVLGVHKRGELRILGAIESVKYTHHAVLRVPS